MTTWLSVCELVAHAGTIWHGERQDAVRVRAGGIFRVARAAAAEGGTGTRAIFSEKIRMKAALQSSSTCGEEASGRVTQEQGGRTGSGKRAWGGANRGTRSGGGTEEGARAHPVGRHVVGDVVQLAHARLDLGRGPLPPLKGARCT